MAIAGVITATLTWVALYEIDTLRPNMTGVDTHPFLCVDSPHWISSTNITVVLSNCGPDNGNIILIGYYVQYNNTYYANPNWLNGPTIPYHTTIIQNLTIDGSSFTFQSGKTYALTFASRQGSYSGFAVSL